MTTRSMEILVGVFVALGFAALFMLAMKVSNLSGLGGGDGFQVSAHFSNIGGLKTRSPVTVSGVRIGEVDAIQYDPKRYKAKVTLTINQQVDYLPLDTSASIYTSGLLGEQYIALEPGAEQETLGAGDEIQYTQSAVVLEELIGQMMTSLAGS